MTSSNETFNPGYCTVEGAKIITYEGAEEDLTGLIGNISIQQSLSLNAYVGSVEILDGIGLLVNLPIRGEEELQLKLKSHDLQTEVNLVLQIVSISNVQIQKSSGDMYAYTLDFMSKSSFEALKGNVITAFRDQSASYCVNKIFAQYYKKNLGSNRTFEIEPSDGDMRVVIPDYNPPQAISFLAVKAFNNKSKSSTYRFFETLGGYYWVTDEWLLEKGQKGTIKKLKYSPIVDRNPLQGATIIETLEEFQNASHVNTIEDLTSGAYKNTVMEIDLITHKKRIFKYDYLKKKGSYKGMQGKIGGISGSKHSEKFIVDTFDEDNSPQYVVYRDWSPRGMQIKPGQVPRADQHMTEIIQNRTTYNYHLMNNMCSGAIRGRLDIQPGQIIDLSVMEPDARMEGKQNRRLSGYYLVFATSHNINGTSLMTELKMVKFDWETEK